MPHFKIRKPKLKEVNNLPRVIQLVDIDTGFVNRKSGFRVPNFNHSLPSSTLYGLTSLNNGPLERVIADFIFVVLIELVRTSIYKVGASFHSKWIIYLGF